MLTCLRNYSHISLPIPVWQWKVIPKWHFQFWSSWTRQNLRLSCTTQNFFITFLPSAFHFPPSLHQLLDKCLHCSASWDGRTVRAGVVAQPVGQAATRTCASSIASSSLETDLGGSARVPGLGFNLAKLQLFSALGKTDRKWIHHSFK